ncbi:hypothetical protein [Risungbinella massiliensis]|uniref:hypothetical protein n=1 Tax=Risungbinella massiliensis TaxID=1329796 RepID=UPI0005CC6B19|nr:hypothetical protein [Risungbinella massiliensis]
MSADVGMSITILLEITVFGIINFYAFKYSQDNIKKRIWAGVIFLLLTPIILFGTLYFVLLFDKGMGWGAFVVTLIATGLYIINGIIVLLSSFYLYFKKSK